MRFEALGPLRVVVGVRAGSGRAAPALGGPKQRLVLALLLAERGGSLSVDRLVDGVWDEDPPESARHTVQAYVSELRKVIGEVIERDGTGYRIAVEPSTFDVLDFEQQVHDARHATSVEDAIEALERSLALWQGEAWEDFTDSEALRAAAARLEAERLQAVEELIAARLDFGLHADVVGELDRLTTRHPYREELRALHMIALYRCGRQAEALRAFQATRELLADELGIMPSPRLRQLEEQILLQDPSLDRASDSDALALTALPMENPYVGLSAFREADHTRFFGRDALVDALVERVGSGGFTALVGPSGSGKSSAVQAGLIPRLRRDEPDLELASMKPGVQPFAELDVAVGRMDRGRSLPRSPDHLADLAADGARRLIVIDQFEELFTMVEPSERARFNAMLARAVSAPENGLHVLVTLRADCYDRPLADAHLARIFADNVVNVPALGPEQLEAAAVQPARQLDIAVEPRLIGRLIADVAGQPNALPLFQYALTELFDAHEGTVLDLATYDRIGGVRRAVARRAESVFSHLDDDEQMAARQLFLRIATVSDDVVGKRRVPASELVSLDVDVVALRASIDAFARYRLLALDRDPVTGAPTVEVAHEALLAEWHRLRGWIDEHRDDLSKQAMFAVTVDEWERSGRDDGYLLTGTRLDDYERWAGTTALRLTTTEQDFINTSVAARELASADHARRDEDQARLRRRSRRQLTLLFAVCAVLAAVVATPLIAPGSDRLSIALVRETTGDDDPFNALVERGFDSAVDEFDAESIKIEPPYTDVREDLERVVADEPTLVFGTFLMHEPMLEVAADHLDDATTFVLMDFNDVPPLDNTLGVTFAVQEGSFLVGAAAAAESDTGKIGYIGANPLPFIEAFRAGYEQGARAVDPGIEIVTELIDPSYGFEARDVAHAIASEMYDEGVDVIFVAAGGSGEGVVQAAVERSQPGRHLWTIGVDSDQHYDTDEAGRAHLLTSMVKRFDLAIRQTVAAQENGSLQPDGVLRLTLADGAVGYTDSGGHLDATTVGRLEEFEAEIIAGARTVESSPSTPISGVGGDPAAVTFDGTTCRYDGPAVVEADAWQPFVFSNLSDRPAGVAVWNVPDGMALGEIDDIFTIADPEQDLALAGMADPGKDLGSGALLDEPGDWLIQCFDDDAAYPAAIFQVG